MSDSFLSLLAFLVNQPRFCPNSTWDNGEIVADQSIVGSYPMSILVNSKNAIYAVNRQTGAIHVWDNDKNLNSSRIISSNLSDPRSIFVAINDDIYIDNRNNRRVEKWIAETNTWMTVMSVQSSCVGLFIDICNNLYCSMYDNHQVVKKWLNDTSDTRTIVAGTGIQGYESDMLIRPWGIFVDINLNLYVAEHGNNQIRLFGFGERNGTIIVGKGSSPATIELNCPIGIVLDGDQYIFIIDNNNHRIVGSDERGFRCIFSCTGWGHSSYSLMFPVGLSFDSYGNLYVTDYEHHRLQKVHLSKQSCGK